MKKIFLIFLVLVIIIGAYAGWQLIGPTVKQPEEKYFYIKTGSTYASVKDDLINQKIVANPFWFDNLAHYRDYKNNVKAGRYEIKKGMSIYELITMLRNGNQAPVNLVITKIRTIDGFVNRTEDKFEFDSAAMYSYITNPDTLQKYELDTNTVIAAIMPNTYTYFWNTTPDKVFRKLYTEYERFWNDERRSKAKALGFSPVEITTLASIVDEETNYEPERGNIASVYINRINSNMPLQADPTVKFALKDFSLRRIFQKHTKFPSPYNTYVVRGLPPGPICTPQPETIDAVLNAPKTEYLYFVAKSDFSGAHVFTTNYQDHLKYAREFQQALNRQESIRKAKE